MSNLVTQSATAAVAVLFAVLVVFIWAFLGSLIGTWLWNEIVPVLFGLPKIKFLQFFGLSLLLHILLPGSSGGMKVGK